jgi:hypothetical protein
VMDIYDIVLLVGVGIYDDVGPMHQAGLNAGDKGARLTL